MASYVTPGFSWAYPDEQKEPSPASTKPMVNPLLKQSFLSPPGVAVAAPDFRVPFSPVENVGIRQRRQRESSIANNAATRKPVRPPTASFLSNGSISNQFSGTAASETTSLEMLGRSAAESVSRLSSGSFERWVLVYGFSTTAQYESLMSRFESFGKIVSHRSGSNWVALEYESLLQTKKALAQASLPMDGIVVGVTRLTLSLRQSLNWNSASTVSTSQQLPPSFQKHHEMKEEDVLLLTNGSPKTQAQFEIGASRDSMCGRLLAWLFGWERYDME